jgi:phosphodiesterase/alkaline phosphatase D-like protein
MAMKFVFVLLLCLPACAQTWFSNVTTSPTTNSCTVHWTTAVPTIGNVKYGRVSGSYTSHTAGTTTYSTTNSAVLSGLSAGTTYHFRMIAGDITKIWITSLDYTCTTGTTTSTQHSVKLNWQASASTGVTGYKVYRSTISGGYYALLAGVGGLTLTDTAVQSGATYYYVVTAVTNAGLQSTYSNQAKAVIP